MLKEKIIAKKVRRYLEKKGWSLTNIPKTVAIHGCDITAWHKKWRKVFFIEVKGEGTHEHQTKHNAFWVLLGQILSRMDIEGNNRNKARLYGIAIPKKWEKTFKNKIKKMVFGWKLLKLKVFLVNDKKVEEKPYNYFLQD